MVMMDSDLRRPRILRPTGRIFTGRVVRFMDGYTREMRVGQPILVAVMTAASLTQVLTLLVRMLLKAGGAGGPARRSFKELKKGPEFLVTPMRLRDAEGQLYEVELHGHLAQSAVHPGDHVQLTLRDQGDPDLPPRIERIVNITTTQWLTPRPPTVWSHFGPPLLLQAFVGVLVVVLVVAWVIAV
ncbi:hypothetical protein CA850_03390 [Micromonospora echinospora]|uniref:Uncharacterized protein n=1 Tax=Micromonospora echinospora TaxID=1877 RepID=A0A1C5A2D0_MICEC|nr:hypothetical protein [Micromonospora echinospora]OZV83719.1 hypothetical protein CA850_03390 [Micromonospora echinospora]SCF39306.1 hypothetical protein GA0070618_6167 [Micromonospora echinospora]